MKKLSVIILSLTVAALLHSPHAWADKGGNGNGKGKGKNKGEVHASHGHKGGKHKGGDDVNVVVNIGGSDRTVIRQYIANTYYSNCPPGLAKKHNGCLPPGQAKKRYIIGQPLPPSVIWEPVPAVLLGRLQPVPVGYQYVTVDKDVLLMSEASHHVIDAITLLSAVGN
jgi:hypothetical protein